MIIRFPKREEALERQKQLYLQRYDQNKMIDDLRCSSADIPSNPLYLKLSKLEKSFLKPSSALNKSNTSHNNDSQYAKTLQKRLKKADSLPKCHIQIIKDILSLQRGVVDENIHKQAQIQTLKQRLAKQRQKNQNLQKQKNQKEKQNTKIKHLLLTKREQQNNINKRYKYIFG